MGERVTKDESSNIFRHQGAAQAAWTANEKEKHRKGPNLFQKVETFARALQKVTVQGGIKNFTALESHPYFD